MDCQICGNPWGVAINSGNSFKEYSQRVYCMMHMTEVFGQLVVINGS